MNEWINKIITIIIKKINRWIFFIILHYRHHGTDQLILFSWRQWKSPLKSKSESILDLQSNKRRFIANSNSCSKEIAFRQKFFDEGGCSLILNACAWASFPLTLSAIRCICQTCEFSMIVKSVLHISILWYCTNKTLLRHYLHTS